MTYYARTRLVTEVADNPSYINAAAHATEQTSTPDEFRVRDVIEIAVAGTTYSLSHLTSCVALIIENLDTTNYVTVVYRTGGGVAADQIMVILAGETAVLLDVTAATNPVLTADTAAVRCAITYLGT